MRGVIENSLLAIRRAAATPVKEGKGQEVGK